MVHLLYQWKNSSTKQVQCTAKFDFFCCNSIDLVYSMQGKDNCDVFGFRVREENFGWGRATPHQLSLLEDWQIEERENEKGDNGRRGWQILTQKLFHLIWILLRCLQILIITSILGILCNQFHGLGNQWFVPKVTIEFEEQDGLKETSCQVEG